MPPRKEKHGQSLNAENDKLQTLGSAVTELSLVSHAEGETPGPCSNKRDKEVGSQNFTFPMNPNGQIA